MEVLNMIIRKPIVKVSGGISLGRNEDDYAIENQPYVSTLREIKNNSLFDYKLKHRVEDLLEMIKQIIKGG